MLRIRGDREQRVGDGLEEQIVDDGLVLIGKIAQLLGQGEDDVEVVDREELRLAGFEPALRGTRLALRTVAVATGVVGVAIRVAPLTVQLMAAEFGRSAALDRRQDFQLPHAQVPGLTQPPGRAVSAHDVGDLQRRPFHRRGRGALAGQLTAAYLPAQR